MIVAHFDAATLAGVRIAVSPAVEAVSWLRMAVSDRKHAVFGDAGASARFALRDRDVALVASTLPHAGGYTADLLTPKPRRLPIDRILDQQLDTIAATPAAEVAAQIALTPGATSPEVVAAVQAGTFAERAANGLRRFWSWAVDDGWTDLRDRVDADFTVRSRTMAEQGAGALLDSLHPALRWDGTTLTVAKDWDEVVSYDHDDFVLSPCVLAWPCLAVQFGDTANAGIHYPAYGVGGDQDPDQALGRLVGHTRARLLRDLDVPRTTTELSDRHRLAKATVSYHLSVMHASGLVTKARDRRAIRYHRTQRAHALGDPAS